MKNIISTLVIAFIFCFTIQAQKKERKHSFEKTLKSMVIDLNLSLDQKNKLKPILVEKIAARKALMEKRNEMKAANQKPTKEQRQAFRADKKAAETAINTKIASVLTKEQYNKYLAKEAERKEKAMQKKKKGIKKKKRL